MGPLRSIQSLTRVPRLQEQKTAGRRCREVGTHRQAEVQTMRRRPRREGGAFRNFFGVFELSEVQLHSADFDGDKMSEMQGWGRDRTKDETEKKFLRMLALSGLRFRFLGQAGYSRVRALQKPLPCAKEFEEKRGVFVVPELQRGIRP